MKAEWYYRTFGQDCLGNPSGWIVERYVNNERKIAGSFVANLYEPGSYDKAWQAAKKLAAELNGRLKS